MRADLRVDTATLAETSNDALVWRVIEPAFGAVNIYDGPEVLARDLTPLTPGQRALRSGPGFLNSADN